MITPLKKRKVETIPGQILLDFENGTCNNIFAGGNHVK